MEHKGLVKSLDVRARMSGKSTLTMKGEMNNFITNLFAYVFVTVGRRKMTWKWKLIKSPSGATFTIVVRFNEKSSKTRQRRIEITLCNVYVC